MVSSWGLRFRDIGTQKKFQDGVMEALCERFTQQQGVQIKDDEREYILEAFRGDVDMLDQSDDEEYVDALDESRGSMLRLEYFLICRGERREFR